MSKKKFLISLLLLNLCSCSPEHLVGSSLGSGGGIIPNPNPDPSLKAAAQDILVSKCIACHGANGTAAKFLNTSANPDLDALVESPYVFIGRGATSPLYLRANDGTMPPGSPLNSSESGALKAWIDDLGIQGGGSGNAATFSQIESEILAPKCYNCHKTSGPSKPPFQNYEDVMYYIASPFNLNSAIYTSVTTSVSPMPKNSSPLSTTEIEMIESWLMDGALNN